MAAALGAGMVSPALAHGVESIPRTWFADPGVVLMLLGTLALYVRGLRALGQSGRDRVAGPWRCAAFFCAVALCVAALESPLDELADRMFSVHMLQHLLLTVVIAPLLMLGSLDAVMLHALPPAWIAKTARRSAPLRSAVMRFARPWTVWGIATATIAFWHLPRAYAWAARSPPVHAFEHLMLVVTACAFWWWVIDPRARRHFGLGAAILYLLSFGVLNGFIGAMLTFSPRPWYALPELIGPSTGFSALEDQQLAGMLMWVGMDGILFCAMLIVAASWLHAAPDRTVPLLRRGS